MLTLEVTGESVADGGPLGCLSLDGKNAISFEYDALQKVIVQLVNAINVLSQQVAKLQEDQEEMVEGVHAVEQQLAGFEVRLVEADDTCKQVSLQVGTMVTEQQSKPDKTESQLSLSAEGSRKDMLELSERIAAASEEIEKVRKTQTLDTIELKKKCQELDETLLKHQDFFDGELLNQLTEHEEGMALVKADLEALQKSFDESNARKATKMEVADIAHRVQTLAEDQASDNSMLRNAQKQFLKLNSLTDLVNENKHRMQEMWNLFGKESQELREWAATGLVELRGAVRSKMEEREALNAMAEIQKDVRELGPYISEATLRLEMALEKKADATVVEKLEDILKAEFHGANGSSERHLIGAKDAYRHGSDYSPIRTFEGRDRSETLTSTTVLRAGGGGVARPRTHEMVERSPPREPPTLVRYSVRRPAPVPAKRATFAAGKSSRSMRDALGGMPHPPAVPGLPRRQQQSAEEDLPDVLPLLRQQPGAHSGMAQPQASDFHAHEYLNDLSGNSFVSETGDEMRPYSPSSD
jgi:hypothetical protein